MNRRKGALLGIVGLVLLVASGCAHSQSDEDQIKTTVRTFLAALGHDGKKACAQLTEDAQTSLVSFQERTPCEKAAESVHSSGPALAYFEDNYEGVRFRGTDNQVAEVDIRPAVDFAPLDPVPLIKTAHGWKITEVGWYFR